MKFKIFSLLLFTLMTYSLIAQEVEEPFEMEELIILHNPLKIPIHKENRNVEIITQKEIQNSPAKTLQELLQYVNGIDLRQRGPMGTQADISLDGGSFEQSLLLLNGAKIIDQQTAHNVLNLPIPLIAIKRIEIMRGPAARVFGINSLTGAINILTEDKFENFLQLQTYGGTNMKKDSSDHKMYMNQGVQLGGGFSHNKLNHLLYLSHDKGNGFRYNTAYENNKLFYQAQCKFNSQHTLKAFYGYVKNGFGANGFYAAPGDLNSKEFIETTIVNLSAENKITPNFILRPQLTYRYNYDDYRYYKHELNKGRSQHYTHSFTTEIQALWQLKKAKINMGVDYRNDVINSSNIHKHTRQNWGFYTDVKSDWNSRWDLSLGTYLNYNSQYGWELFPGIDASYRINEQWKFLGNLGTSQRIPSFTDLYLDQRPGNIGNENLLTEKAIQSEMGIQWKKKNYSFQFFAFHRTIQNFIDWTRTHTEEPWQSHNQGKLRTNGIKSSFEGNIHFRRNSNMKLIFQYSYLDSEIFNPTTTISKYQIEILKHQFTQIATWEHKNTNLSVVNRFNQRVNNASYWITDIRGQQKITPQFTFFIDIQNVFNASYTEIGSIPLPTRWMSLGVNLNLF
jgi:outer membrane cobalamin receptor